MPKQLLHQIDVSTLLIKPLGEIFPQRVRRKLAVQSSCLKRPFQHLMSCLPVHCYSTTFIARQKQRTAFMRQVVLLPESINTSPIIRLSSSEVLPPVLTPNIKAPGYVLRTCRQSMPKQAGFRHCQVVLCLS